MTDPGQRNARYWDATADAYRSATRISTHDFHYGPLLPGDAELRLLPADLAGRRCLEIGAGAGQNSIYLASGGAHCVALDISARQIEHGEKLAAMSGTRVAFQVADMDRLPTDALGAFDLVHSTYALPFSSDPGTMIRDCGRVLRPGGIFLLTTSHPAYAGDWIELEHGEEGVLLHDYFRPGFDRREADDCHEGARSDTHMLSTVAEWLRSGNFTIDRLLEPEPLPIPSMTEEEILHRVPYDSPEWRELYPVLAKVPTVAVFRCIRNT